jgi:hypothetical protein
MAGVRRVASWPDMFPQSGANNEWSKRGEASEMVLNSISPGATPPVRHIRSIVRPVERTACKVQEFAVSRAPAERIFGNAL